MGILSALALAGVFLGILVALAALVAGWELLRQRMVLDDLRREREHYVATSPLPLMATGSVAATALQPGAPAKRAGQRDERDGNWIATRPAVLHAAPAVDDNWAPERRAEVDLMLD